MTAGTSDPRGAAPLDVDARAPGEDDGRDLEPSLLQAATDMLGNAGHLLDGWLELVALESRRAGLSLAIMLAAGVAAGVVVAGAWLFVVAAGAAALVSAGFGWPVALLAAALANLAIAVVLWLLARGLSHRLTFAASRRQLRSAHPASAPGASS